ncbi:hypothetical protein B296_00015975 [Ensete ventricosum]|uniref:Uncharacterized protein n=1 Tax=Ensete ventricosum TaxID=4639 RepID=A0A427AI64_ENSVE|nr:hypothetical protein B296_00015975 [Ensete ventricosum]
MDSSVRREIIGEENYIIYCTIVSDVRCILLCTAQCRWNWIVLSVATSTR